VRDGEAGVLATELVGPIDAESAIAPPSAPSETGAFGVAALDSEISLSAIHAQGFAVAAVVIEGGSVSWDDDDVDLDVEATHGAGVLLVGTNATLRNVELGSMLAGIDSPGLALVATASSSGTPTTLTLEDARIAGGPGYGIFADRSDVVLAGVAVEDLGLVGVQVQGGSLAATDLTLRGNGGAGLAALDAARVSIERGTISEQRTVVLPTDFRGVANIGDGIHVRRTSAATDPIHLTLTDVSLSNNERTGLLIDAMDTAPSVLALSGVSVTALGTSLGALAQRTIVPTDWDAEITRDAVAAVNDGAFTGTIDPVGLVMPPVIVARPPSP
jgi:hypothetical protein